MTAETEKDMTDLDWIQLRNEFESMHKTETMIEKIKRKNLENPFVPIGCLATFAALSYGLWAFRQGKQKQSQYMMRVRVVAQGFTIVAFVLGLGITASRAGKP